MASFFAQAEDPDYFDKTLNLFVALAPTIIMKHAGNPTIRQLAGAGPLFDWVQSQGFLEIYGKRGKKDALVNDINENASWICQVLPQFCNQLDKHSSNTRTIQKFDYTNVHQVDA